MSETLTSPYTLGDLGIHDAGEVFTVRVDYKELDLATGHSEAKVFMCDALATDAAHAMVQALGHVRKYPPPVGKIWDLKADVSVQSDVLRDELNETLRRRG